MSFALRCSLIGMGKLIYGFNVSVDGYIADARGNIDWSEPSEELHQYWNDFERETALSFYGRRLYELMSAYWPTADKAPDATPLIVDFAHIWRDMPLPGFRVRPLFVDPRCFHLHRSRAGHRRPHRPGARRQSLVFPCASSPRRIQSPHGRQDNHQGR